MSRVVIIAAIGDYLGPLQARWKRTVSAAPPKRIQRSRAKGWRKPEGAIIVDRTSRWGNPFDLGVIHHAAAIGLTSNGDPAGQEAGEAALGSDAWHRSCHRLAAEFYREYLLALSEAARATLLDPLRGHDLVCFCRLDFSCHADVLLELANRDG